MVSKTGIGIGNGIPFWNMASGRGKPYLSPELKSRLRIVAYTYGKRNGDADRATIRNLVDPDNPLICHNFAWIPNSGYGFTTNYVVNLLRGDVEVLGEQHWLVKSVAQEGEGTVRQCINQQARNANFAGYTFNIKCSNIKDTDSVRIYYGYNKILKLKNGDNIVTYEAMPSTDNYYVFDFNKEVENIEIKVEPIMQDALVTDGVNDIIIATKTAGEMFADMGNETAISFVSKFHLIDYKSASFNNLRNPTNVTGRNLANKDRDITRKDIIIGWTKENINNNNSSTLISGILGDDADYIASGGITLLNDQKFSPVGYIGSVSNVGEVCKIAYEWTIGGIGTFTEDDINQIIAYYNLDRTLKADIYCNIEKQGITNENHNDFSNQLIDYSGNGRNIQMNNLGWVGGSGIAAKQGESIRDYSIIPDEATQTLTIYNEFKYKIKSKQIGTYWTVQYINKTNTSYPITIVADKNSFWVNSCTYYDVDNNKQVIRKEIEVSANTPTSVLCCGYDQFDIPEDATSIVSAVSYINYKAVGEITVEFIPSHKGAVILDGINDFGKTVGLPIYKDYTFAIEREILALKALESNQLVVASKSARTTDNNGGAFILEIVSGNGNNNAYSFYGANSVGQIDKSKQIIYQSKYKYLNEDITIGSQEDSNSLWIGTIRDGDNRFANVAIYSLISFSYSMNKFLLDRQLKKYKAGTLYKDMVQFRPVIKQDDRIKSISYFVNLIGATVGEYYSVGSPLGISIETVAPYKVTSLKVNGKNTVPNADYKGFNTTLTGKSPQKITTTIEVDETLVRFNPTINSNVPYTILNYYTIKDSVWTPIKVGDYLPVAERVAIQLKFNDDKGDVYEVIDYTCPNMDAIVKQKNSSVLGWTLWGNLLKGQHTQNITIEVDEYIKYEDIV